MYQNGYYLNLKYVTILFGVWLIKCEKRCFTAGTLSEHCRGGKQAMQILRAPDLSHTSQITLPALPQSKDNLNRLLSLLDHLSSLCIYCATETTAICISRENMSWLQINHLSVLLMY